MPPADLKSLIIPYRDATARFDSEIVRSVLGDIMVPDASLKLCHPFGTQKGPEAFYHTLLAPLKKAGDYAGRKKLDRHHGKLYGDVSRSFYGYSAYGPFSAYALS